MLKQRLKAFKQTLYLMVGQPDYEQYCAFMRHHHPNCTLMSYEEFYNNRLDARYSSKGGALDVVNSSD
ncbi:putative selenoprotein [Neisseriaceae bacterium PsAf]|nr:putative selenoprotein [Neisseriaceae bacterium PsAf]